MMCRRFLLLLFVFGLLSCAQTEAQVPTSSSLSPESDDECHCSVRKRQQIQAREDRKKQLDPE